MMNSAELIRQYLDEYTAVKPFSGVVYVVDKGIPIFQNAYGMACHEFNIPNTIDTCFSLASVSMPYRLGEAIEDIIFSAKPEVPKRLPEVVLDEELAQKYEGTYLDKKIELRRYNGTWEFVRFNRRRTHMSSVILSKEQKRQAVQEIRQYFSSERDEEIGDLAGEMILDFFTEKIGPFFYNQAIIDVQKYMNEKVEDLYGMMK